MNFDYYVNEAIGRLFRYAPATGSQERWDSASNTWVNVAPALVDDIYSGRVELEEVTAEQASNFLNASKERLPITVDTMNRIQVYIAQKSSIEEFLSDYEVVEPELSAAKKFYAQLQKEISERKLEPGQFWDVSAEWS